MTKLTKKTLKILVYWFILPLLIFYGVMWIFHPEEKLLDHLNSELNARAGIHIDVNEFKVTPLGKLILEDVTVKQTREQTMELNGQKFVIPLRTYFSAQNLKIQLGWKELFHKQAALHFSGVAYSGEFEGIVQTEIQQEVAPMKLRGEWASIDLEKLSIDYPKLQVNKGRCHGRADLVVDQSKIFKYQGPVELNITNGSLSVPESMNLRYDLPEFKDINAKLNLNFEAIAIEDAWLYSSDTSVNISGLIYQKIPIRKSWLDLKIKLYLTDKENLKMDQFFPATIKGPADDPDGNFMGMDLKKLKGLS